MRPSIHRCGVSLVELLVVIAILALLIGLTVSGVQKVRATAARARCADQMRQVALGLHSYHAARGSLPAGWTSATGPDRYSDLGWTARVLPHLEQQTLWQQIEAAFRTAPRESMWQEPHRAILGTPVGMFACPGDDRARVAQVPFDNRIPVTFTSYLGISDHRPFRYTGVLFPDSAVKFTDITDGTSSTLMLGERPPAADFRFGWWYRATGQMEDGSAEMLLSVRETRRYSVSQGGTLCPSGPYHFVAGRLDNQCDMFHFWSPHTGGAHFAFADGSVRFLRYSANEIMPALATRAGGESVSVPD